MKIKNRKAQIGETMTWVIATIVIIVILVISIFITSFIGKGEEKGFFPGHSFRDLVAAKSLSGYLLTPQTYEIESGDGVIAYEGIVFEKIKMDGDLDHTNGPLSVKIFRELYVLSHPGIFLDLWGKGARLNSGSIRAKYGYPSLSSSLYGSERIYLDETKYLGLFW